MKRFIPEVGALYERVRRPARMVLVGLALMVPALGFMVRRDTAAAQPGVEVAPANEIARAVDPPAWGGDREEEAARFAREYRIPQALAQKIHEVAVEESIEPRIAFGLVKTESSFRRRAVSHAGAVGYTQVLPSTARWMAPGTTRSDLFETETNLRLGFRYLNYLLDKYDGDVRLALTAYNRGPGTVDRLLRRGHNPENGYATKVLRFGRVS